MCLPLSSTRGGGAGGVTSGLSTPVYATAYHNSKTQNGAHVQVLSATSPPSSRLLESNQIVETGSERSHQVRGTAGHSLISHIARPYARILESSSQCRKSRSKKCDMPPDTAALLVYSCVPFFSQCIAYMQHIGMVLEYLLHRNYHRRDISRTSGLTVIARHQKPCSRNSSQENEQHQALMYNTTAHRKRLLDECVYPRRFVYCDRTSRLIAMWAHNNIPGMYVR